MNIQFCKELFPFACKNDDSVLISSKHGIGKSSVVEQFTIEEKYHFEPLFLSTQEIGDLIGLPKNKDVDGETVTYWTRPEWLDRIISAENRGVKSVLFLDELNRAHPDVLQSILQLVLDGRIHDHNLPKGELKTFIISAINPSSDYQTLELDPALLDRFLKLDVEVDANIWLKWAKTQNINTNIINFITANPDYLHFTPEYDNTASEFDRCGSSPRSLCKVSMYVDFYEGGLISNEQLLIFIKGKVGKVVGYMLYSYIMDNSQMDHNDVINLITKLESHKATHIQYSEQVKLFMEDTESFSKINICEQILYMCDNGLEYKYLLIYLYSLNIELLVPQLKGIKEKHIKVYDALAKLDIVNNKELFTRIVKLKG